MNIERGEILRISLNPTKNREQQGNARPCLVLSNTRFNQRRQGIIIVSPITNTIKPRIKTLIQLPSGFKITGSVVAEQVRTLDLSQRWWETTSVVIEKDFVDSVVHIINQIVS
jgi:mRNA-degrading endonuclease toxin of MazEF toxin-antitoxin module